MSTNDEWLVAEVERLRARLAKVEALADEWQRACDRGENGRHGYHSAEYGDDYAADLRAALASVPEPSDSGCEFEPCVHGCCKAGPNCCEPANPRGGDRGAGRRVVGVDEARQIARAFRDPDYVARLVADTSDFVEVDNPLRREVRPRRGTDEDGVS